MTTTPRKKLIYVVTEDWYFWLHRLAIARGARDAGYEVIVAARVQAHGERIRAEGFTLEPLPWRRGGGTLVNELRTLALLWRLFRRERPDIVHSLALKPIIYAGLMARLAMVRARVATVAGLGYVFTSSRLKATLLRWPVTMALGLAMGGRHSLVTLENPDDGKVLTEGGAITRSQVALICSCGIDIDLFQPVPEPAGIPVVAMATRLVRDKGAGIAAAAVRRLKQDGVALRFRLAGNVDPENPDSYTQAEVDGWVAEGTVEWDGFIDDVAGLWHRSHIAVYPSRYGEGVPKTLIEAAACGKPAVTTDMPGCREAVDDGITGFLVPVGDDAATADRIRRLVEDAGLRQRMGEAARAKAVAEFADAKVVAGMLGVYEAALA